MCDDIERRVADAVAEVLSISKSQFTMTSRLVADLHMDDLDSVMLLIEVEDEFGIEIPDAEAAECETPADFAQLVRRRQPHSVRAA